MSGMVVPVRISLAPPPFELPYRLFYSARGLMLEPDYLGYWKNTSPAFWNKLDAIGPELIARQLAGISKREGGKPLTLCCFEDVTRPHRCHRVVFSLWWQERTGEPVYELTDEGELLHLDKLHPQCMPVLPEQDGLFSGEAP